MVSGRGGTRARPGRCTRGTLAWSPRTAAWRRWGSAPAAGSRGSCPGTRGSGNKTKIYHTMEESSCDHSVIINIDTRYESLSIPAPGSRAWRPRSCCGRATGRVAGTRRWPGSGRAAPRRRSDSPEPPSHAWRGEQTFRFCRVQLCHSRDSLSQGARIETCSLT